MELKYNTFVIKNSDRKNWTGNQALPAVTGLTVKVMKPCENEGSPNHGP